MKEPLIIRDFVYLDTERLKSILSQVDRGLLLEHTKQRGHQAGAELTGEASLFTMLKSTAKGDYLWRNEATETRTLHDHLYNLVEDFLLENDQLLLVPSELTPHQIVRREGITSTAFVLLNGFIEIESYATIRTLLSSFNDFAAFLAYIGSDAEREELTRDKYKQLLTKKTKEMGMSKELIEGFKLFIDLFAGERLTARVCPDPETPECRFSGALQAEFLRESFVSLVRKYGSAPQESWTMLAQVASLPAAYPREPLPAVTQSEIEQAFSGLFSSYREMEAMAQTVAFPEVSVTPIALYRD